MPGFPIVDAHLHVWDPTVLRYERLGGMPFLNRPYLLSEYRKDCGPVDVERMVFVQADADFSMFLQEAEWVTGLARDEDARIRGIVAWAPLETGDAVRPHLEQLAGQPLVKGIRRIIQWEPDPAFCLRPDFIRGVQALPDYGMHFEICIAHTQMASAIRMVEQCPRVTFVLNHIGKPDIEHALFEPWAREIRRLSEFPNMWCKASGLVTEADRQNWTKEDLKPYIDHVMACFGPERVMFGGDWPVVRQAAEFPRWVQTLEWAMGGCSERVLRMLFRDNANTFYRLD